MAVDFIRELGIDRTWSSFVAEPGRATTAKQPGADRRPSGVRPPEKRCT